MSHSQEVGEQKLKWRARYLGLEEEIGIRSTVESRKHWDRKNAVCCHLYIESETYNSLVTMQKEADSQVQRTSPGGHHWGRKGQ